MCQTNVLFQIVKPVFGKICCSQYLYICSRHITFHNVQLSSVVECWTTYPEIAGSNPDPNLLVKFQLKKFRFQIWKVVFRIRSVNHKNIRMMTHGVKFQSFKLCFLHPLHIEVYESVFIGNQTWYFLDPINIDFLIIRPRKIWLLFNFKCWSIICSKIGNWTMI